MKRKILTPYTAKVVLSYLITLTSLYVLAFGQSTIPCQTPPYSTDAAGAPNQRQNSWPQGMSVTVIIDQRFSPEQRTAVMDGMNRWLNNGSGVTFNFNVGIVPDTSTRPPANTTYVLADPVNRADIQNFTGTNGQVESSYIRLGSCTRTGKSGGQDRSRNRSSIRFG